MGGDNDRMGMKFDSFEESLAKSDKRKPYEIPDRSGKPYEEIYQLPMREYQTVQDARQRFGGLPHTKAIERAFEGHSDSFSNLTKEQEQEVLEFLKEENIILNIKGLRARAE